VRRRGPETGPTAPGWTKLLVRFVAVFLIVMGLLAGIWSFVAPGYTAAVAGLARPLFRGVERPNVSVLEARGAEVWIYRIVGPGEVAPFTWFDRYTFFAVIPLLALFAATPGLEWRQRVSRLALGAAALFLVHVGYLVASIQLSYVALGLAGGTSWLVRTVDGWQIGVRTVWEAAPVAIWIVLTFGQWKRVLQHERRERRQGRQPTDAVEASS